MWLEYISNLHNGLPTLKKRVSSFLKLENKILNEFEKVERQVEYCLMLIVT
jgi:hypothetical protein